MSTFPIAEKDVERCKAALESRTPIAITTLVYNKERSFSGIVQAVEQEVAILSIGTLIDPRHVPEQEVALQAEPCCRSHPRRDSVIQRGRVQRRQPRDYVGLPA